MTSGITVTTFEQWRAAARGLIAAGTQPASVWFSEEKEGSLFGHAEMRAAPPGDFSVPKAFLELAELVALHRDPRRWHLLYRTLYRIVRGGERHLLELEVDPDVRELALLRKAVARDIHKMHAFVRFRKVESSDCYVAWHRPDHHIVEHVGPWFARRFGAMNWAILTPERSAYWDTRTLRFGPGVPRSEAPEGDTLEDLWRAYYANIFNPARVNVSAMVKELPVRHWATLPEAELIPGLLLEASGREGNMRNQTPPSAEPFVPADHRLPVLADAVRACRGCDLYLHATQAVFGEGPASARILFVGEQPGDQEDVQGRPFVGPAGQLWNRALDEAQIDRTQVYVTNAVKHFKFEERGKRRIHKKPGGMEVAAWERRLRSASAAGNLQFKRNGGN
jgi:DNA polymerase